MASWLPRGEYTFAMNSDHLQHSLQLWSLFLRPLSQNAATHMLSILWTCIFFSLKNGILTTFLIRVGVCQRAKDYDDVQFLGLLLHTLLSNKVIYY